MKKTGLKIVISVILAVLVLSVPVLAGRRGRGRDATNRLRFARGMRGGQRMGAFAQTMRRGGPSALKGQYCPFDLGPDGWGQGRGMDRWRRGFQGRGGQAYGRRGMMQRGRQGRRGRGMGRGGQAFARRGTMQRGPMMGPGRQGGAMGRGGQAFGRRGMMQQGPIMGPGRQGGAMGRGGQTLGRRGMMQRGPMMGLGSQGGGMVRGDRSYQGRPLGPFGQGFEGWGALGGWQRGFGRRYFDGPGPGQLLPPAQDEPGPPDPTKDVEKTDPTKDAEQSGPPMLRRGRGLRGQGFQGGIPELRRRDEGPRRDTPPDTGARRRRPRLSDEEPES